MAPGLRTSGTGSWTQSGRTAAAAARSRFANTGGVSGRSCKAPGASAASGDQKLNAAEVTSGSRNGE